MTLTRLHFAATAALGVLLLAGAGATNGNAAPAATGGPLTLRFNLDKGAKYIYDTAMKITMAGPATFAVTEDIASVVEIVDKTDHGFRAKTTLAAIKMDLGSAPGAASAMAGQVKSLKGSTSEATFDALGNVQAIDFRSNNATAQMFGGALGGTDFGFQGLVCPDKPVEIGSTWETSMDLGQMLGKMGMGGSSGGNSKLPIKFKLAAVEEVGGKTVARIDVDIDGTVEFSVMGQAVSVGMVAKGTMHVQVDTCLVLDSTLKSDNKITVAGTEIKQQVRVASKLRRSPSASQGSVVDKGDVPSGIVRAAGKRDVAGEEPVRL